MGYICLHLTTCGYTRLHVIGLYLFTLGYYNYMDFIFLHVTGSYTGLHLVTLGNV